MLTPGQVQEQLSAVFQPHAAFIAQIANVCIQSEPGSDNQLLYSVIPDADLAAEATPTPQAFLNAFILALQDADIATGAIGRLRQIPLPALAAGAPVAPAPPNDYRVRYADDLARLRRLRTPETNENGSRLAAAAARMVNWFFWTKSGPREPGFGGHSGEDYLPKVSWTSTRTDAGIDFRAGQNDFASWIVETNGLEPTMTSFMNCWEAVLFSAFRARLVDKVWLQTIHRKAALAYRFHHAPPRTPHGPPDARGTASHYSLALSQAFNFFASVPFVPLAGLIPRNGDLLFWNRDEHVAISLGRSWIHGQPEDRILSLWHHNGGRLARLRIEDISTENLRFLPCPFGA